MKCIKYIYKHVPDAWDLDVGGIYSFILLKNNVFNKKKKHKIKIMSEFIYLKLMFYKNL